MIRNVVFDMGQVLIRFYPELFLERLNVSREDWPIMCREVFHCVEWVQLDRGVISEEAALAAICRRLPDRLHAPTRRLIQHWWEDALVPVEGMAQLVAELKEKGYGVYLLSNATLRIHSYFSHIPGSGLFDGHVVSSDYRQLKPEREIYETLFQKYGLDPRECFFIDDLPINIEGAIFAGMDGTVFSGDVAQLRNALRRAGIPVA